MVMSVLVSKEGKVCVAHDSQCEGTPVSLNYSPLRKSLTLVMDSGEHTLIGSATLPEISRKIQDSARVMILQIRRPDPAQQFEIPVHIQTVE